MATILDDQYHMITAPSVYLDTNIVSGLAKEDLAQAEVQALHKLLQYGKEGRILIVTSPLTLQEISLVPEEHRSMHEVIYNLIEDVPVADTHRSDSSLPLTGAGGGRREDPLLVKLKSVLPDEIDAQHLFHAAKNNVEYFLTVDHRTILNRRQDVKSACGVIPISPVELLLFVEEND